MTPALSVDVVIIGAGAGGGVVAEGLLPLVRDGLSVLLLERGPRITPQQLTTNEAEMVALLYHHQGAFLTDDGSMSLAMGRGVGGSSLVHGGIVSVPSHASIASWNVPGLHFADLEQRALRLAARMDRTFLPPEAINENNRLFAEGAARLGLQPVQLPISARGCRGAARCHLGCPNGAPLGTVRRQLPEVEAAGVRVVSNAEVVRLEPRRVHVRVTAPDQGLGAWPAGDYVVDAPLIVVAAGAVETPALLWRSGFGATHRQLGRRFTCHPTQLIVAEHPRVITSDVGHPTSYQIDRGADAGFVLEPTFATPMVAAAQLTGFGPAHAKMMRGFPRLQMLRAIAHDTAADGNRITIARDGSAIVHYEPSIAVRRALVAAQRTAARVAFAAGAVRVHLPAANPTLLDRRAIDHIDTLVREDLQLPGRVSLWASHLMGGAAMGRDARDGVTDASGRVHGAPWLRIADASLIPNGLDTAPSLTVMALADRVAEAIRDEVAALRTTSGHR